jgi:hypothetical protein
MRPLVLVLVSLIFSVLALKPALALSFQRRVPEHVSATCILVQSTLDVWSNDTEISQLNSLYNSISLCQSEFKLWFWEELDAQDLTNLYKIQWLSLIRVHNIRMDLEREIERQKGIRDIEERENEKIDQGDGSLFVTINTVCMLIWTLRETVALLLKSFAIIAYLLDRSIRAFSTMIMNFFSLCLKAVHYATSNFPILFRKCVDLIYDTLRCGIDLLYFLKHVFFKPIDFFLRLSYTVISTLWIVFVLEYEKCLKLKRVNSLKLTKVAKISEQSSSEQISMTSSIIPYHDHLNYLKHCILSRKIDPALDQNEARVSISPSRNASQSRDLIQKPAAQIQIFAHFFVKVYCEETASFLKIDVLLSMDRLSRVFTNLTMKRIQNNSTFNRACIGELLEYKTASKEIDVSLSMDRLSRVFANLTMKLIQNNPTFNRACIGEILDYKTVSNEIQVEEVLQLEDFDSKQSLEMNQPLLQKTDPLLLEMYLNVQKLLLTYPGNHSQEFSEIPTLSTLLDLVVGHTHVLAKTQIGSKFLQHCIEEEKDVRFTGTICNEVLDNFSDLAIDLFGNYLCQSVYIYITMEKRLELLRVIGSTIVDIACSRQGTRVVQTMISCSGSNKDEQELIGSYLADDMVKLMLDPHGSHVSIALIESFSSESLHGLLESVCQNVFKLAVNPHGLCVLKTCLTKCGHTRLISRIMEHVQTLVNHRFGNYAIQHILTLKSKSFDSLLHAQFKGRYNWLSKQKFSSNVIEKCIECFDPLLVRELISELMEEIPLLIEDSFANFVLQKALQCASEEQKRKLVGLIQSSLKNLRKTHVRKRWEKLIVQ